LIRDRSTITGGSRLPFPLPRYVLRVAISMILEDEPEHRRLRTLVHKAFTPRALSKISGRVEEITHELLDKAEAQGTVDLMQAYSLPIPVTVIREMLGVDQSDMDDLSNSISALTDGLSGFTMLKTFLFDLPKASSFVETMIAKKRENPGDDILTALIQAEEDGERLSEDELVAMVFLLIIAGYETTVHLINNAVITLLTHQDQFERLRAEPELMDSAVEEILRFSGPIEGTKPFYPTEDIEYAGVTIPKGETVMPLLGAANRDPRQFENPNVFDIARTPNRHLGFSQGIHYCLGAPLARMETKIALKTLIDRNPNLKLAIPQEELKVQSFPAWVRHKAVPVILG
ncbi:MAG: cytochrome P450, partial [Chloroflexota bacterium]